MGRAAQVVEGGATPRASVPWWGSCPWCEGGHGHLHNLTCRGDLSSLWETLREADKAAA